MKIKNKFLAIAICSALMSPVVFSTISVNAYDNGFTDVSFKEKNNNASLVEGNNASAGQSSDSTVIGENATSACIGGTTVIGTNAFVSGNDGIAIGDCAVVTGQNSITIGSGNSSVDSGDLKSVVTGNNSIGIGTYVGVTSDYSVSLGHASYVSGLKSIAIGADAHLSGTNSVALGTSTTTDEDNVVAIGNRRLTQVADAKNDTDGVNLKQMNDTIATYVTDNAADKDLSNLTEAGQKQVKSLASSALTFNGDTHISITKTSNTDGTTDYTFAIKDTGTVTKDNADLVTGGTVYDALHQDKVDLGKDASATGNNSIAIGGELSDTDEEGSPITSTTEASGDYSIALGSGAKATGEEGLAFGAAATANGSASIALGSGSEADGANSIALGAGSIASTDNVVSVGNDSLKRRITNVADGIEDNDAVNMKQVRDAVAKGVDFGNLSEDNTKALKTTIRETVKITDGEHTIATSKEDGNGNISYSVNVDTSGMVAEGNNGIVTGGAIYNYIAQNSANRDLSNLNPAGKTQIRTIAGEGLSMTGDKNLTIVKSMDADGQTTFNVKVNATGKATKGNTGLVDGNTLYEAVKDIPTSAALENKASVDLDNVSSKGEQKIFNVAKDAVKVLDGDNTTVTKGIDDTGATTYKIHAVANGKIEAKDTNAISGDTAKKALDTKANRDASNLTDEDIESWQDVLSEGAKVQEGNAKLLTGGDVYDYTHQQEVSFGKNSTALNGSIAIGGEFIDGDERTATTASGRYSTAIGAGAVASGDYAFAMGVGSIVSGRDSVAIGSGTVNNEDSTVAIGNRRLTQVADAVKDTDAVNFGQLKDYVDKNSNNFKDLTDESKSDLKNIIKDTVKVEGGEYNTITSTEDKDGNLTYKVDTKVDGKIEEGNTGLVTGGDIHDYVKDNTVDKDLSNISDKAIDKIKDIAGSSVDIKTDDHLTVDKTTDENGNTSFNIGVKADGKAEKGNTGLINGDTLYDALKDLPTQANMEGKANTDLDNISDKGKETIKDIAKDSVKVINGENTIVTKGTDANGNTTYEVNAVANGKLEDGNTGAVSGDTVKKALDNKADIDASNLTGHEQEWADKLGVGKVEKGNNYLVTGDTVYNDVTQIVKDTSLVKSDGSTITVGAKDTATKIDFSGANGNRTLTGIETDANDASSAANVGYVNSQTEGLSREMSSMRSELRGEINDATAKAGAIASLHPQDYDPDDKLDFAAGFGHYKGSSASAIGVFYRPNENTTVNVGATVGAGDPLLTAGVSMKLGKGNSEVKSRNGMAKEIKELKGRNADLEEEVAYLEDQMHQIKQLLANMNGNPAGASVKSMEETPSPRKVRRMAGPKPSAPKQTQEKKMTRYEYAQMLYNALRAGKKVNYAQLREFTPELKEIRKADTAQDNQ